MELCRYRALKTVDSLISSFASSVIVLRGPAGSHRSTGETLSLILIKFANSRPQASPI